MSIEHDRFELFGMNGDNNNRFSANFLSLQLQLKTLLEEAGGDELVPFLDTLASLNRSEQQIVLKLLTRSVAKLVESTPRFVTDGDLALKQFEENLFQDLVAAIHTGGSDQNTRAKVEVIPGGKRDSVKKSPIDLEAARKKRRSRGEPLLN